jgi:hypothetical protein
MTHLALTSLLGSDSPVIALRRLDLFRNRFPAAGTTSIVDTAIGVIR